MLCGRLPSRRLCKRIGLRALPPRRGNRDLELANLWGVPGQPDDPRRGRLRLLVRAGVPAGPLDASLLRVRAGRGVRAAAAGLPTVPGWHARQ